MWALLLCTSTSTSVIGSLYGGYKSGRLALCQAPLWLCAGAGVAVPRRLGLAWAGSRRNAAQKAAPSAKRTAEFRVSHEKGTMAQRESSRSVCTHAYASPDTSGSSHHTLHLRPGACVGAWSRIGLAVTIAEFSSTVWSRPSYERPLSAARAASLPDVSRRCRRASSRREAVLEHWSSFWRSRSGKSAASR